MYDLSLLYKLAVIKIAKIQLWNYQQSMQEWTCSGSLVFMTTRFKDNQFENLKIFFEVGLLASKKILLFASMKAL